jgi:vancomycin resistance protein VanJ
MKWRSMSTWATGYTVFIALWVLLRVTLFDRVWPLALLNTIAEYLFVPVPLLLAVSVWKRHWSSLALLSIPTIVFIILFGELFWPLSPNRVGVAGVPVTAMSFNVLYSNGEYEAVAESVRSASPDVIGFQELTLASSRALSDALEDEYPYTTLSSLESGQSAGLLSRFPIESAVWFDLPPRDIALHTTIRVGNERIHVYVVHLSPNNFFEYPLTEFVPLVLERYARRADEVTRLQKELGDLDEPALLLCDCNFTDTSEAHARLNMVLGDSFREAGWGFGHTIYVRMVPFPVQRIDYVWHSDDFVPVKAFVGQDGGSDHLPAVAKLILERTHESD